MTPNTNSGPASAGPLFDALATATRALCAAILVALVSLVCLEALLRGGFNYSLGFAEELTGYGVVMMTFFGAALSLRAGTLFQVHFLLDRCPERTNRWLVRGFALVALFICIVLAWKTKDLMLSSLARGKFAPTVLRTPLWIPQMVLPLGFGVIAVFVTEKFLLTFKEAR
ncbi:TRAP transporter small permease [Pseudoprimorskyibacter insulae]|uniref:TRAP transporter small permease protein n=1 Tax=Pseudoprimorskyibacter insulae TaxID=1695997 RepID=A0A2R8B0F2_9RHOB|nr:TRAP transporter small permease [Pseudoprimorskyibacter insulae]SPF81758.1 hypothetical protein PRI8871_03583 [Pseudoprimorskyibacter insulae]